MRHIIYAIQDKTGAWMGYLQKNWEKGEHGQEGSPRWVDPTKSTFETREDALAAAQKLADDNGIKEVFKAAEDIDYKAGVAFVAAKDAVGTATQKMEAERTAETAEIARAKAAVDAKAGG